MFGSLGKTIGNFVCVLGGPWARHLDTRHIISLSNILGNLKELCLLVYNLEVGEGRQSCCRQEAAGGIRGCG
jgi:hypothetical protein